MLHIVVSASPTGPNISDSTSDGIEDGSIRLVGGTGTHEGRVEIYFFGRWGTVCDSTWNLVTSVVLCRQLGHFTALAAPSRAAFGKGTGFIWLDQVVCAGYETTITQCSNRGLGVHYCRHDQDAGAICLSE